MRSKLYVLCKNSGLKRVSHEILILEIIYLKNYSFVLSLSKGAFVAKFMNNSGKYDPINIMLPYFFLPVFRLDHKL